MYRDRKLNIILYLLLEMKENDGWMIKINYLDEREWLNKREIRTMSPTSTKPMSPKCYLLPVISMFSVYCCTIHSLRRRGIVFLISNRNHKQQKESESFPQGKKWRIGFVMSIQQTRVTLYLTQGILCFFVFIFFTKMNLGLHL